MKAWLTLQYTLCWRFIFKKPVSVCVLCSAISLSRVQSFLSYHVTLLPILLDEECCVTREQKRLHTSSSSSSSSSFDHCSGRDIEGDILPNTVIRRSRGGRLWLNSQTLLPNSEWPNKSFNLALVSMTEQLIILIFFFIFSAYPLFKLAHSHLFHR